MSYHFFFFKQKSTNSLCSMFLTVLLLTPSFYLFSPPFTSTKKTSFTLIQQTHQGKFKKYVQSRFPSFDPLPPPCLSLFAFQHLSPQGPFLLARTPLAPSISILVKFRENKLIMSTSIFD